MKVIRALVKLVACDGLCSGCLGASTTRSAPAHSTAPRVIQPDLPTSLPDSSIYPTYAAVLSLVPRVSIVGGIAAELAWNMFGVLTPEIAYAGCMAVRDPDVAPYAGCPIALDFHDFEDKPKVAQPDQATAVGVTVARGRWSRRTWSP